MWYLYMYMTVLLEKEKEIPSLECMVRLFTQTPDLQISWKDAADKYGEDLFPNLHSLAAKYFLKSSELTLKWQSYQNKYGKRLYPDLNTL